MTLRLSLALVATAAVVATAAQQQEVRVVTSDVKGVAGAAMAGGGAAPMATGTGVVFGQIVEAGSSSPVAGAIVSITLPGSQPLRVMADGQGRFGFRDLPAGRFNVTATRAGFVDGAYGRQRPSGPTLPIGLVDGEHVSGVSIPLWRYASITGRVVDESGDPLINMPVRVMKRTTVGGKMRLQMVNQDSTDDRGTYRASGLEPGDYVVVIPLQQGSSEMSFGTSDQMARELVAVRAVAMSADMAMPAMLNGALMGNAPPAGVGEDGRPLAFPTMFYPNVLTSSRATVLTLSSGDERGTVDFQLKGVPISRVSGVAMGPDGPVPNLPITLVPAEADDSASSIEVLNGYTDEQGRFTVESVPPGQYILRAVRMPRGGPGQVTNITSGGQVMTFRTVQSAGAPLPTDPTLWAEQTLAVGTKDVKDVAVGLRAGVKVTGTVQFNGSADRPTPDQLNGISISLEPADQRVGSSPGRGRIEATTSTFATVGVPPGKYFVRVNAGFPNWSFQAATANGRDASVVPIDLGSDFAGVTITFTDRPTELSGQVSATGALDTMTVLVFPAESSAWVGYGNSSRRFVNVRADKAGNFKVSNLPAGEYFAIAIPDRIANDWQNPKFLESLTSDATRVRMRDGDKATATLKAVSR